MACLDAVSQRRPPKFWVPHLPSNSANAPDSADAMVLEQYSLSEVPCAGVFQLEGVTRFIMRIIRIKNVRGREGRGNVGCRAAMVNYTSVIYNLALRAPAGSQAATFSALVDGSGVKRR